MRGIRSTYNPNEIFYSQILQVLGHKFKDQFDTFWDYYFALKKLPKWYSDSLVVTISDFLSTKGIIIDGGEYLDPLGNKMAENVNSAIANGNKVLMISHSQGNFYANYISRYIRSKTDELYMNEIKGTNRYEALSNLQIASPSINIAANNGRVINRSDDKVINWIVDTTSGTAGATHSNLPSYDDFSNHGILATFLKDPVTKKDIKDLSYELLVETNGLYDYSDSIKTTITVSKGCQVHSKSKFLDGTSEDCFLFPSAGGQSEVGIETCTCFCTHLSKIRINLEFTADSSEITNCEAQIEIKSKSKAINIRVNSPIEWNMGRVERDIDLSALTP